MDIYIESIFILQKLLVTMKKILNKTEKKPLILSEIAMNYIKP